MCLQFSYNLQLKCYSNMKIILLKASTMADLSCIFPQLCSYVHGVPLVKLIVTQQLLLCNSSAHDPLRNSSHCSLLRVP